MGKGKKIRFIFNPRSGLIHPETLLKKFINIYFPSNLCEYDFIKTERRFHALESAHDAVKKQYDIVVAIGGDGTVNETASALVNSETALGIIPVGSGNGLARELGIPLMMRQAIKVITRGEIRFIDVGLVDNRYFFATAGMGFDAVLGKRFDDAKIRGPAPYYFYGVKEFFRYRAPRYEIKFDGKTVKKNALIVAVANSKQYGNNVIIAPSAEPDDGFLDVAVVDEVNLLSTLYYLPSLFSGKLEKTPIYEIYRSTHFDIYREFPAPYTLDGEVYDGDRHLSYSLLPKALKVITGTKRF
jgi:YegS/Rv2252/BmrU family lipid kinase